MKTRSLTVVVLIVAAICLAGCKFQASTTIKADGSGELRTEVGFTAEERQNLEQESQNSDSQDFCNSSSSSQSVEVSEEQRGDETWCVTTASFNDLDELRRLYQQRKGVSVNRLEILDGKFYYDVDIDTVSESSDFSAFSTTTWIVTMPETPTSYNAAQVNGNILTWEFSPNHDVVKIQAESGVPAAGFSFPCGGALIGAGLTIFWGRWSKQKKSFK